MNPPLYEERGVKVYKVSNALNNEILCVKEIQLESFSDINEIQNDYLSMLVLSHPNISKLYGINFSEDNNIKKVKIYMKYYEEKDLGNLIIYRKNRSQKFTAQELIGYMVQLIDVFSYIQDNGIAHRDIKPTNIFVSGSELIVGDFGDSIKLGKNIGGTLKGTDFFLSPILKSANIFQVFNKIIHNNFKSDVFSLGLTFLCMADF